MFHIVDFKAHHHSKEKTVVPDIWLSINNTLCALPPNASNKELEGMAQNRVEPGPGWQIFGMSLLKTFNTYSEARRELERSKESSQADEGPQRNARRKRGLLSEYSESDPISSPTTIFKTELLDLEELSENEWTPTSEVTISPVGTQKPSSDCKNEVQDDYVNQEDISTPVDMMDRKADCYSCKHLSDCIKILKKQHKRLEKSNSELNEEIANLRAKYRARKIKYRNLKNQIKDNEDTSQSNLIQIGKSTLVERERLITCHETNASRFTGDLLEVVFGKDVLSNSTIKKTTVSSKQPLEQETLRDVILFAADKFNVSVEYIRAAVRQKLNTCHKARTRTGCV